MKGGDGRLLLEHEAWRVHEMIFDYPKIGWLWTQMSQYRTLFSDVTKGDINNFWNLISIPDSFWMEVVGADQEIVGIVYITNMQQVVDVDVHLIFFDRQPAQKVELCKRVAAWLFKEFHFHRLTATIPVIYYATVRLAEKIGFQFEGRKRQSQLMGAQWVDEVILGLLQSEVRDGR